MINNNNLSIFIKFISIEDFFNKINKIKESYNILIDNNFYVEIFVIIKNNNLKINEKIINHFNNSLDFTIKFFYSSKNIENYLLYNNFLIDSHCNNIIIIQNNNCIYKSIETFIKKKSKILVINNNHFAREYEKINVNNLDSSYLDAIFFSKNKIKYFKKINKKQKFLDMFKDFINDNDKKIITYSDTFNKLVNIIKNNENKENNSSKNKNYNFENYLNYVIKNDPIHNVVFNNFNNKTKIDCLYIINKKKRVDRKTRMIEIVQNNKYLKDIPIIFIEAFEGNRYEINNKKNVLFIKDIIYDIIFTIKIKINQSRIINNKEMSYIVNWYKLLKHSKNNKINNFLYFDDDIILHKNFNYHFINLQKKINNDYSIYFIGSTIKNNLNTQDILVKAENNFLSGSFALIVNTNFIDKIINSILEYSFHPFDSYILHTLLKKKCYLHNPNIVLADIRNSDIKQKRNILEMPFWNTQNYNLNIYYQKVSVILPVDNIDKITYVLDSINFQNYSNVECIIIDNTLDINSSNFLKSLIYNYSFENSNKNYRYISNKKKLNFFECINLGIQKSTGKYIILHDNYSISLPNRFINQINNLNKFKSIINCSIILYSKDKIDNSNLEYLRDTNYMDFGKMLRKFDLLSCMYKKEIFEKYGLFNEKNNYYNLYEFIFRIFYVELYKFKINKNIINESKFIINWYNLLYKNNSILSNTNNKTCICFNNEYLKNTVDFDKNLIQKNNYYLQKNSIINFPIINNSNYINKYFSHIYLLNLNDRIDKKINMISKLKELKINFENFVAINGKKNKNLIEYFEYYKNISLTNIKNNENFVKDDNFKYHDVELRYNVQALSSIGSLGILHSYKKIIEDAKKNKYKRILILQDDCIFHKNFNKLFIENTKFIHPDWKLLYLGASQVVKIEKNIIHNSYYNPISTDGAFAVGYSCDIFDELLEQINLMNCNYDLGPLRYIANKYNNLSYVLYPNLIIADVTTSDNQKPLNQEKISNKLSWDLEKYNFNINYEKIIILVNFNIYNNIDNLITFIKLQNYTFLHIFIKLNSNQINNQDNINKFEKLDNFIRSYNSNITIELQNNYNLNLDKYKYFFEYKEIMLNIIHLFIPIHIGEVKIVTKNHNLDIMMFSNDIIKKSKIYCKNNLLQFDYNDIPNLIYYYLLYYDISFFDKKDLMNILIKVEKPFSNLHNIDNKSNYFDHENENIFTNKNIYTNYI